MLESFPALSKELRRHVATRGLDTRPQKKPGPTKNGRSRVLHHLYGYVGRQHGTSRHLLPATKLAQTHSGEKNKNPQDNQRFAAQTPRACAGEGKRFLEKVRERLNMNLATTSPSAAKQHVIRNIRAA